MQVRTIGVVAALVLAVGGCGVGDDAQVVAVAADGSVYAGSRDAVLVARPDGTASEIIGDRLRVIIVKTALQD